MKLQTEKQCNNIIEKYKDFTQYFNEQMSFDEMYNMLHSHYGFGEVETMVIIACLVKNGAKFR